MKVPVGPTSRRPTGQGVEVFIVLLSNSLLSLSGMFRFSSRLVSSFQTSFGIVHLSVNHGLI